MINLKPSFFIVGAPKSGTTALYDYLALHPEVCMSSEKEPNFFSDPEIRAQGLYYRKKNPDTTEAYLALFVASEAHKIAGECSVSYLFYPQVPPRIRDFNPQAKIIISLRQPASRAFSHYLMDYSLGLVKAPFDRILYEGKDNPSLRLYYQQYIELGFYYAQVKRYIDTFPANQILIFLHEELVREPANTLSMLSDFLGIRNARPEDGLKQSNVSGAPESSVIRVLYQNKIIRKTLSGIFSPELKIKIKSTLFSKRNLPVLSESSARHLNSLYSGDIALLEGLIGKNLQHWINP